MFIYKIDDETELRLYEERDAEQMYALFAESRGRHAELDKNFSLEDVKGKIRLDLDLFAKHKGLGTGIWYCGKLAGGIRYHEIDLVNRTTELGYWLGEKFEGKGLVIKACRALIDHAFGPLGLNRIVISCAVENKKSRAVPEKLGFKEEGVARQSEWQHESFVDMVIYAMLADEWRNKYIS
ncbi:MAG: GNAT family N-acetyltransferase [Pyrinomonadaceae bacterium]|jgi:ribosomal-protein-serine acetyltransferase